MLWSTTDASQVLASGQDKNQKMRELIELAEQNVDIQGIGLYTLGKYRKNLSEDQIKEYEILFKSYFLKSFSSIYWSKNKCFIWKCHK